MPGKKGRRQSTAGKKKKSPGRSHGVRSSSYQGPRAREWTSRQTEGSRELGSRILQKYLEPERDREREIQQKNKEIMASKARKEKHRREVKEAAATRVSYVRKPFAGRSKMSAILIGAALLLGGTAICSAVATKGQATLTHAAMALCSMFLSVIGIWYGGISFLEDDKNYILAKLGIGLGIAMLAGWAVIVFMGFGGFGQCYL